MFLALFLGRRNRHDVGTGIASLPHLVRDPSCVTPRRRAGFTIGRVQGRVLDNAVRSALAPKAVWAICGTGIWIQRPLGQSQPRSSTSPLRGGIDHRHHTGAKGLDNRSRASMTAFRLGSFDVARCFCAVISPVDSLKPLQDTLFASCCHRTSNPKVVGSKSYRVRFFNRYLTDGQIASRGLFAGCCTHDNRRGVNV